MSAPQNSLTPADYATPEQIDRNLERLRKIGDRGRTGNLLAEWEAKEREDRRRQLEAEFDARQALRLGQPVDEPAAPVVVTPPKPAQENFEFHARGDDLPLFAA